MQTVCSYFVKRDGLGSVDTWAIISPYNVGDGGTVIWDEESEVVSLELDMDKKHGGALIEVFRNFIKEYME